MQCFTARMHMHVHMRTHTRAHTHKHTRTHTNTNAEAQFSSSADHKSIYSKRVSSVLAAEAEASFQVGPGGVEDYKD